MRKYTKRKRPFETLLMSEADLSQGDRKIGTALVFIRADGSQSLGMMADRQGRELDLPPGTYDARRVNDWRLVVMPLEIQ